MLSKYKGAFVSISKSQKGKFSVYLGNPKMPAILNIFDVPFENL
jgi:hypothetical protein